MGRGNRRLDGPPDRSDNRRMSAKTKSSVRSKIPESSLRFSPVNGLLLLAGTGAVVLGYIMLAGGSTVGAPLLLVLGYAVLIPLGIIL